MAWHAVTRALISFSFFQDFDKPKGIGFLRNKHNNTGNNVKSQIQSKKNGGIGGLLMRLNKVIRNQGTYFVVIMNNRLKVINVLGAPL